jgi:hypothetical protein
MGGVSIYTTVQKTTNNNKTVLFILKINKNDDGRHFYLPEE